MAAMEDMLCLMTTMMPLMMPFAQGILFDMCLLNSQETQVVCCFVHPCFEGHTVVAMVMKAMTAAEDLLCTWMMTLPLMMLFVQGILFSKPLQNVQETQIVCH
jgi:Sec-independent protein secretion pathway component TatC